MGPLCSEDDLPVPANGKKACVPIMSSDLECELTCNDNYHFGTSVDISPQYCRNGEWDFQRNGQSVPDCVGEWRIVASICQVTNCIVRWSIGLGCSHLALV